MKKVNMAFGATLLLGVALSAHAGKETRAKVEGTLTMEGETGVVLTLSEPTATRPMSAITAGKGLTISNAMIAPTGGPAKVWFGIVDMDGDGYGLARGPEGETVRLGAIYDGDKAGWVHNELAWVTHRAVDTGGMTYVLQVIGSDVTKLKQGTWTYAVEGGLWAD